MTSPSNQGDFVFGPFTLDIGARRLLRGTEILHLSPKAFELLKLLAERSPAAVSKQDIHAQLWQGTFVTDINLAVLITELRSALGETARRPTVIRTVHRFGYAFSAPVTYDRRAAARASACWIEWERGTKRASLSLGDNTVGRDPAANIYLDGVGVSRHHAIITVSGEQAMLKDLGSKNGTFADGIRVVGQAPLAEGSEISFGAVTVVFHHRITPKSTETVSHLPRPRSRS